MSSVLLMDESESCIFRIKLENNFLKIDASQKFTQTKKTPIKLFQECFNILAVDQTRSANLLQIYRVWFLVVLGYSSLSLVLGPLGTVHSFSFKKNPWYIDKGIDLRYILEHDRNFHSLQQYVILAICGSSSRCFHILYATVVNGWSWVPSLLFVKKESNLLSI